FPGKMSGGAFVSPIVDNVTVTSASPMFLLSNENFDALPTLKEMFLGLHSGCLGEVCGAALIIGGIYLVIRKVISPVIPCVYIGTVAVFMLIAFKGDFNMVAYEILGGGLLLGAIFMATDYTTSPINFKGKIIFAIGCGLITSVIRLFGSLPEGVSFSIILMNIFVPHIDNLTTPKPFGTVKQKKEKAAKVKEEAKV
ncbi:MAG: RnfABCDGE type electron transport complex subunit D, partial [Oscillospiraceae bacterium]